MVNLFDLINNCFPSIRKRRMKKTEVTKKRTKKTEVTKRRMI